MIKRYVCISYQDEIGEPAHTHKEYDDGPWVKFEDHQADKRELVEMLEKYQSNNRIHNDTESELFYEAAALIAKHKEGV